MEGAPPPLRALHPDPPPEQLDELAGDGQPEAGPAVLPRGGGVGLGERPEDRLLFRGRDADAGVGHREVQAHSRLTGAGASRVLARLVEPDADDHLTVLGFALSLASLYMVLLVYATQRRDDQLAERREQLTLELALLNEQKTAKLIELTPLTAPLGNN